MSLPIDGTVPTSKGALYTVPTGRTASVGSIHISNGSGSSRTATVYVNFSGTSRAITPVNMALAADAVAISEAPLELFNGASIEGVASGSGVSFVISGTVKKAI